MTEFSEISWSHRHAPRSVKPEAVLQTLNQPAIPAENIDKSQAISIDFIFFSFALLGERHKYVRPNRLHIERRKSVANLFVFKCVATQMHRLKIGVVHFHFAA